MPNVSPRIAITPSVELKATLEELALVLEKPTATLIVDLLNEMQPQLLDLTKIFRHAKAGKSAAAKRALRHMMGNALAEQLEFVIKERK